MARQNDNKQIVIQDARGCTLRYLNWRSESPSTKLTAVWLPRLRRVDFAEDVETFTAKNEKYEVLGQYSRSDINLNGIAIKAPNQSQTVYLRLVEAIEDVRADAEESQDSAKPLPLFIRYSAAAHVGILILVFAMAWIMGRYFHKNEPVTVQVFSQAELPAELKTKTQVVDVADHKIKPTQLPQANAHKTAKAHPPKKSVYAGSNRGGHGRGRPGTGTSLANSGALGVLGGMGPQYHGSGGLNIHSKSNNPGIGYGGPAQRGGFERGLLGKGLVATGIGDGSSLQGYGGTASHGLGGGAPGFGYGHMKMAGSSGAYFEPLGEDSLIEGGLDRDQINSVIQRNLGEVTYCYEEGLQSHPKMTGRVAVRFVIGSQGVVSTARVANTTLSAPNVESCIVQKLRGWRFPKPTGNVSVRVTYPFVLKRLSQG